MVANPGVVDFALTNQPNFVTPFTSLGDVEKTVSGSLATMILFTDKLDTPPLLKGLAAEFKGRLSVGEVKKDSSAVCEL